VYCLVDPSDKKIQSELISQECIVGLRSANKDFFFTTDREGMERSLGSPDFNMVMDVVVVNGT
jgi:hypothetical protein